MTSRDRSVRFRWAPLLILGLMIAAGALAASPAGAWLLHPATPVARDVRSLFYKAVWITMFFFVGVEQIAPAPCVVARWRTYY